MDEDQAREVLMVLQSANHAGASRDDLAEAVEEAVDMLSDFLDEDEDEEEDDEDEEDEDEEEEETKEVGEPE